ncbi:unnamed protein product [Prorocentrum cordatum]|uniref:Uncharacterized protein n=1 Tax=Prorocentrum cordatum TaxID=2364126 RepID=A0ABN9VFD9_9DINO|nr:unnamed protein product [Polarella glacialis]
MTARRVPARSCCPQAITRQSETGGSYPLNISKVVITVMGGTETMSKSALQSPPHGSSVSHSGRASTAHTRQKVRKGRPMMRLVRPANTRNQFLKKLSSLSSHLWANNQNMLQQLAQLHTQQMARRTTLDRGSTEKTVVAQLTCDRRRARGWGE